MHTYRRICLSYIVRGKWKTCSDRQTEGDRQVNRQAVVRLLSVWGQYWPNTLVPSWRHQHSMRVCVCLASLRQATCPKHNVQECVHGCVIDLSGAIEMQTQSCCLFSQTAKSMWSGFEWRQYTLLSFNAFVCVGDPDGNPRRQSTVDHYRSNHSAAKRPLMIMLLLPWLQCTVPLHLHLERDMEKNRSISWEGTEEKQQMTGFFYFPVAFTQFFV